MDTSGDTRPSREVLGVDPQVLLLGVVSFLTDASSEMIFSVLSIYLTVVLGAPVAMVGAIEGLADLSACSLDVLSGHASDRTGRRKGLALLGYGLSTTAKAFLLLASTAGQVLAFRVVERLGKSIRGAPRDALLAAISPPRRRGLAFGIHKAMDRAGAIVGPLAAFALLERFGPGESTFRLVFAAALAPALLSLAVLAFLVRERTARGVPLADLRTALRALGPDYRRFVGIAAVFSLAYSSFAFLLLKATLTGFEPGQVALLYALFSATSAVVSGPLGWLGDRLGRRLLIAASYAGYAALAAGLATASSREGVLALFVLYGVFLAIDEGQTKAFVADLTPEGTRALAVGVYNFVAGLAYLPASFVAGALWDRSGPAAAFGFGSGVAALAFVAFVVAGPRPAR